MKTRRTRAIATGAIYLLGLGLLACGSTGPAAETPDPQSSAPSPPSEAAPSETAASSFIVQGRDFETVKLLVEEVGGTLTHELRIIKAVGAMLTPDQLQALEERDQSLRIHEDRKVEIDFLWADGYPRGGGYIWTSGLTETMGINHWVEQE